MQRRHVILIAACFLLGALLGAYALLLNSGPGDRVETSGKALVGGPSTLVDASGKTVTDQDFRGRYMLIFFGYTHCPDICPAELQVMAAALDQLGDKAKKVVPIFITLDPERDTPQVLKQYVPSFHPSFLGLYGDAEATARTAKEFKVFVQKQPVKNGGYSVDHGAGTFILDRDGKLRLFAQYGQGPAALVHDIRILLRAS